MTSAGSRSAKKRTSIRPTCATVPRDAPGAACSEEAACVVDDAMAVDEVVELPPFVLLASRFAPDRRGAELARVAVEIGGALLDAVEACQARVDVVVVVVDLQTARGAAEAVFHEAELLDLLLRVEDAVRPDHAPAVAPHVELPVAGSVRRARRAELTAGPGIEPGGTLGDTTRSRETDLDGGVVV